MIKLNIPDMDELAQNHLEIIFPQVKKTYEKNNSKKSSNYISLLEDEEGNLDEELIKLLLTGKINEIKKNPKLKFLFDLGTLICEAPVDKYIRTYVDSEVSEDTLINLRKEHINKYKDMGIFLDFDIKYYIGKHTNYYENKTRFSDFIKEIKTKAKEINNCIKEVFNYTGIIKKEYRHELLYKMGISVCPYCNRQYISNYISIDDNLKTTGDLDHFYPQNYYSFLSLSIYNYIPSCQICNSRMKCSYSSNIIYPYEEEFEGNAKFEIDVYEDDIDIGGIIGESNKFKLRLNSTGKEEINIKIAKSVRLFKLEEVYKTHEDYIREILVKKQCYKESKRREIQKFFEDINDEDINIGEKELDLLLYGTYINYEDLDKRPLSKLTRDIINE